MLRNAMIIPKPKSKTGPTFRQRTKSYSKMRNLRVEKWEGKEHGVGTGTQLKPKTGEIQSFPQSGTIFLSLSIALQSQ